MLSDREALSRLMAREDLTRAETEALFGRLMDGDVPGPVQAALLVALRMKGEARDEITGAAAAMRARVTAIPHRRTDLIDTCGTGGDGRGSFNISTAAAFVAAAAGATVAKHGNRSVSSRSGSADVLAALGVPIEVEPELAARALDEVGIAFLFASRLHPAMKHAMPVRRALGVRTLFNVLGPLTNPAGARRQLLGVYAPELVELLAGVLADLGSDHALVVHGSDGLDEITTTGRTRVAEVRRGRVEVYDLDPRDFGVALARPEELSGGDPEHNAVLMRRLLGGESSPLADVVALNAAAALYVAGVAESLAAGLERAREALGSGAAGAKLEALARFGST